MRVGIVARTCKNTGSSKYVIETSRHFAENNEVHIFANSWDRLDERIKVHKVPVFPWNYYAMEASFTALSTIMARSAAFDVTLAQPTRYFTPKIAEMQFVQKSWVEYRRANRMKLVLGDSILPKIEAYNLKRCKMAIAISKSVADDVVRLYGMPEEKIRVIYSGVNCEEFDPKNRAVHSEEIRRRHGIADDEKIILFQGNPFDRKGLEHAIRALPLVHEKTRLVVVGKDDMTPFIKIARGLGVQNKVLHVAFTNEMKKYFAAADVFVLPSLYDTFALVALEAMASGCGVIVSRHAGVSELIKDGKDGFVLEDPANHAEIAEKTDFLLNNGSTFGRNARRKAEQYGWDRTAREMLAAFEEVVG